MQTLYTDWSHEIDVLSAALDSGLAIGQIIIFFTLLYPDSGKVGLNTIQAWWGNTVQTKTADFNRTPLMAPPAGDFFGYVACTLSPFKFGIDDVLLPVDRGSGIRCLVPDDASVSSCIF